MDAAQLLFWKPGPHAKLSPPEIARELMWGEEVEGLVDLPVREIIDRVKAAFPQHEEKSGHLICQGESGSLEVTWSWQYIRAEVHGISLADRERFIDVVESCDCMAYDPQRGQP
jgi:hypothetical protein